MGSYVEDSRGLKSRSISRRQPYIHNIHPTYGGHNWIQNGDIYEMTLATYGVKLQDMERWCCV
jgi:hypothetical protein